MANTRQAAFALQCFYQSRFPPPKPKECNPETHQKVDKWLTSLPDSQEVIYELLKPDEFIPAVTARRDKPGGGYRLIRRPALNNRRKGGKPAKLNKNGEQLILKRQDLIGIRILPVTIPGFIRDNVIIDRYGVWIKLELDHRPLNLHETPKNLSNVNVTGIEQSSRSSRLTESTFVRLFNEWPPTVSQQRDEKNRIDMCSLPFHNFVGRIKEKFKKQTPISRIGTTVQF